MAWRSYCSCSQQRVVVIRPEFLRERRPPTLVATGANDQVFPDEVVRQILTDQPDAEYHALQTGHFALEDKAAEIAALMRDFLARIVPPESRLERPTPRAPGRPGATAGSQSVLTGRWRP